MPYLSETAYRTPNGTDALHYELDLLSDACARTARLAASGRNSFACVGVVDRVAFFNSRADMLAFAEARDWAARQHSTPTPATPCPQLVDDVIVSRQAAI